VCPGAGEHDTIRHLQPGRRAQLRQADGVEWPIRHHHSDCLQPSDHFDFAPTSSGVHQNFVERQGMNHEAVDRGEHVNRFAVVCVPIGSVVTRILSRRSQAL